MSHLARLATAGVAGAAAAFTAIILAAAPSTAAQSNQPPLTFSGQCQLAGTVAFTPLMTSSPGLVRNQAAASGTCSGSLIERSGKTTPVNNAPVQYRATEVGTQESCELNTDAPGSGELTFQQGTLGFGIVENRVAATALLSWTGDRGGSASAVVNVNSPNPLAVIEQCSGAGVASVPFNMTVQTTPSISG